MKYKITNTKRLFISEAGFLLIKEREYKNGRIDGFQVSDSNIEKVMWHKDDEDIIPFKK